LDFFLSGDRAHDEGDLRSGSTLHTQDLGADPELNSLVSENALQRLRDVGILSTHELRPVLYHGHVTAEAPIGLGELKPHVAASEHDEMRRQIIELERLDVRERAGGLEPGHARNGRVRADVDEHPVADQHARVSVVQLDLERLRGHEPARAHDELGAARLIVLQVRVDLVVGHATLDIAHGPNVARNRPRLRADLGTMTHERRDLRTPDLVLAGHAIDVRTGATNPSSLHDGRPSPRSRHVPRQELAARATTKNQDFKSFRLRHASHCRRYSARCWTDVAMTRFRASSTVPVTTTG